MKYDRLHRWITCWCLLGLGLAQSLDAGTLRYRLRTATNLGSYPSAQRSTNGGSSWSTDGGMVFYSDDGTGVAGHVLDASYSDGFTALFRIRWTSNSVNYYWPAEGGATKTISGFTYFDYPYTPDPTEWTLKDIVSNNTSTRRKYRVDADGDGIWDAEFELGPGEQMPLEFTRDTAPTSPVVIQSDVYLGDGNWGYASLDALGTNAWYTATPTTNYTAQTYIPRSTDTRSQTNQAVSYQTASGGGVQESTFKTGTDAVRSAIQESGDKAAEEVARLRTNLQGWLGKNASTTAGTFTNGLTTAANSASGDVQGTVGGFTNSWVAAFTGLPTASAPPSTELAIKLGTDAHFGQVSVDPDDYPEIMTFAAFAKSAITWVLWVTFICWTFYLSLDSVQSASKAPQGQASTGVPVLNSTVSMAMGAVIVALTIATLVVLVNISVTVLGWSLWSAADNWRSWAYIEKAVWWAELFVPLTLVVALALTAMPLRVLISGLTLGLISAIRVLSP